ncbi:MAG: hypothetical protein ABSF94_17460 [Steroidobacteraceae bacterium]|jgi:hypothetical protein
MDTEELKRVVAAAGFIFRGSIHGERKLESPPLPKDAGEVVAARIEEVIRSTPVLRGLAGREALVVTKHSATLRQLRNPILFTECLSLGEVLLLREIGHVESSHEVSRQVAETIREVAELPLRARVAAADLIVEAEVVDSRPLERPFPPRSEHDPAWSIARVTVTAVLKGRKPKAEIEVLFASSDDIVWFRSPKLRDGASGILLLIHLKEDEIPKHVPRSAYQATDPLDFLPIDRRGEIERLVERDRGGR